jgi:hypothetical protein
MYNLFCRVERLASRVLIRFSIVHFQRSKQRVFEADIDADDVVDDGIRFVGLEGR